ncbi:RNI-like protein [Dioscorea alata]|uniref:RNI-like protein n=4 Tax=Dioscorea alata TaxID=55571 RepID=A0ACB7WKJ5_DIOAL|nr:RNI-like protein [Dioscorea alata]
MDDKRCCSKCLLYHLPCNLGDNRSGQWTVPSFPQLGFHSFTEHILERKKLYLLPPECCLLIFDKLVRMHGLALKNLDNFRKCHLPLIHLGGYPGVRDSWMNVIASQGEFLISLDISCSIVTDRGLVLLKDCFGLRNLALNYCYQISDRGLGFMSSLSQLRSLSIIKNKGLTAEGIEAFTNLSNLENLNLERCSRIHGGLIHLRGLTKLKSLNIKYCNSVTDEDMEHLSGLHKLSYLDLLGCPVTFASLETISGFTSLLQLNLNRCDLSDVGCQKLSELIQLKDLNLGYNGITNACLINLKGLTNLESLNLEYCQISSEGLLSIEGLTSLRTLELSETGVEALSHLSGLHNLENLNLSCTSVEDDNLAALSTLTSLKSLNLDHLEISDASLPFLSIFSGLTHLDLSGCCLFGFGMGYLYFTNLQSLEISDGFLNDFCTRSIKDLTSLKLLNLSYNSEITDVTLERISGLTALCSLNLSNTAVTGAGLRHLKPLTNLRSLYLNNTRMSALWLWTYQRYVLSNLVIFQPRWSSKT